MAANRDVVEVQDNRKKFSGAFETFLMQSSIDDYVPAIKSAILFFDKIHLNPQIEIVMEATNWLCAEFIRRCPSRADAEALAVQKLQKQPRTLRKFLGNKAFREAWLSQLGKKMFQFSQLREEFEARFHPLADSEERVRADLDAAIRAGLVDYYVPSDRKNFADEVSRILAPIVDQLKKEIPARFAGIEVPDRREEIRFAVGARQAAMLSRELDCPISSTETGFLEFLAKTRERVLQAGKSEKTIWKGHFLAERVLDLTIPDLRQLPLEAVVEARQQTDEYIDFFRREIFEVAEKVESEVWNAAFERELRFLIVSKIRPRLQEAANDWEFTLDRLWSALGKTKTRVAAGGLVTSLTAYFSSVPSWLLALVAASLVIPWTAEAFWQLEDKAMARNGFGFLIKVQRQLE